MDITAFLASTASPTLSSTATSNTNPHISQHHHLSRQILSLRRKLGITKPPPKAKSSKSSKAKAQAKEDDNPAKAPRPLPSASDIAANHDHVRLFLLLAARAHTHALAMKEGQTSRSSSGLLTGKARKQIISRLHKAAAYASNLATLLHEERSQTGASDIDVLEATAYARRLSGVVELEKHVGQKYEDADAQSKAWKMCLNSFAEAHVAYSALLTSTRKDVFRETLNNDIEPSLRYSAYQSGLSRSIPIPSIAKRNFRPDQTSLKKLITTIDPSAFSEISPVITNSTSDQSSKTDPSSIPTTITWRGHIAPISDSQIGPALAATSSAASTLQESYTSYLKDHPHESKLNESLAALYDPVLTAATDTLEAVNRALGELTKEGASESDKRIQDLRIAALKANYDLISWRVGRNRVLISSALDDGLEFHPYTPKPPKPAPSTDSTSTTEAPPPKRQKRAPTSETTTHALSRLQTRTALLDSILQSLDILPSLPGAARSPDFLASIERKRAYFRALRCLGIAYSHQLLIADGAVALAHVDRKRREVLALVARALGIVEGVEDADNDDDDEATPVPTSTVTAPQVTALHTHLSALSLRHRATIHLHTLLSPSTQPAHQEPLINNLHTFHDPSTLDLANLVTWPPRLEAVPVKPVFLDVAWNYVEYPGRKGVERGVEEVEVKGEMVDGEKKRKGWFGFGR